MNKKTSSIFRELIFCLTVFFFWFLVFSFLSASEEVQNKFPVSQTLAKHEVTVIKLSETEDFIIIPPDIENFRYGTDLLLHPKKEGKYFLIRFYYDEKQKKVVVITETFSVGDEVIPPEPTPIPTPTDFEGVAKKLVEVTGKKELAKKVGDMINGVLVLVNQGRIKDPLHLRETIRYNLRINLGSVYEEIDKVYDEPILKPFLEQYVKRNNIETLKEYSEVYRKLAEAFKKVGE